MSDTYFRRSYPVTAHCTCCVEQGIRIKELEAENAREIERLRAELRNWELTEDGHRQYQGGPHPCCRCHICTENDRLRAERDEFAAIVEAVIDANGVDYVAALAAATEGSRDGTDDATS